MQITSQSSSISSKWEALGPNVLMKEESRTGISSSPQILRSLGKKLGQLDGSILALRISEVKNYAESHHVLQSLLARTDKLIKRAYVEESYSCRGEIAALQGLTKEMEMRIRKLQSEGAITVDDAAKLAPVVNDFYELFSSLEHWLNFQQRYFTIDGQLDSALSTISPSVFSPLHGVSPSALKGTEAGIEKMALLIALSTPLLKQQGPFASDLLQQLSGDVAATCWSSGEWLHDLDMHYGNVLANAQGLWANSLKCQGEIERFEKMQEAAELLLSGREVLEGMINVMPRLKESISNSKSMLAELEGSQERSAMEKQIGQLERTLDEFAIAQPKMLKQLDTFLKENKVRTHLAISRKRAEKVLTAVEIDSKFNEAVQGYKGESVESYVSLKKSLRSLLILKTESTENIKGFLNAEEKRLSTAAGYQIDFDELLRIRVAEEGEAKPGFASRIFSAIDPANWSEKTVQRWRVGLAALQLSANLLENYQKIQQAPGSPEPSLPAEKQELLDKESAFLGVLLSDKYQAIKNPAILETFTQKMPALGPILKAVLEHYPNAPTASEQTQIMSNYRTERHQALLHGIAIPDQGEKVSKRAAQAEKTERTAALPLHSALLPCAEQKAEALQSLQTASATLEKSQRVLHECRAIEYLFPSIESCPASLQKLKEEVAQLQRALREAMATIPKNESPIPSLVDWSQGVEKQCFEVKDLEKRIGEAMLDYQDSMATSLKEGDSALDRFGNKHKNIVKQANLVDTLGLEGIIVPGPRGISSDQVLQFLAEVAPEIFDHWKTLGTLHASYQGEGPFLESTDAAAHLKSMQEGIEKAFAKASLDDNAFRALGLSKEVKDWLADMRSRGNYLMVRSTGAEDSRKHANAGGNDSIAYVEPTISAFCDALGKVVRSYFGSSSLQNRLNADINPFEEALKMAVTAQELIGESVGGASDPSQIPVSLVLFSNEPLYIGDEEFRTMRISAAYGHGEGVVGNKGIAGDTALILQSRSHPDQLYILYDNQHKPTRLAPVMDKVRGKIVLDKLPNTPEMTSRPALNSDLLRRLYEWGVIGEKFFDDFPTDMEIVIKGGKIYPVQARPVNRPSLLPTYLDLKKVDQATKTPIEKTLFAEMLVPGMASVVEISQPDEILIAETLEKAESQYLKGQHKLVVVAQPEPANSHPVVNFSNLGVPCLYAKEFSTVQQLVGGINEQHQLAVCMQSASINLWNKEKGSLEDFQSQGFIVHPAKVAISLPLDKIVPEQTGISSDVPAEVKELLYQLRTATTSQSAQQQLRSLRDHAWIKAFKNRLKDLEAKAGEDWKQEKLVAPAIAAARALDEKLERAFSEVQAILQLPSFDGRLELLLHIKVVETLLFQKPSSSSSLAQHSILGFANAFAAANALIDYQKQLPHLAHLADLLLDGSMCPIDEVFEDWKKFLLELEPIAHRTIKGETNGLAIAEIARFKVVLQTLRHAGVLPIFTTFFFGELRSKKLAEALRAINNLLPASEEPLIERLALQKQTIHQLKDDLGKFGEPKDFPAAWERLQKIAAEFHPDKQPWLQKAQWEAASPITRSIALQAMDDLVDLYDSAIKAMKASPQFTDNIEKTQKFKQMLGPYFELLRGWAARTVGADGFATHPNWPLASYLAQIKSIYNGLPDSDPNQLQPSQFSVSAAVLGAGTVFERHFPDRLEDVFTLIHQNLMASTSALTKGLFSADQMANSPLPETLKRALERVLSIGGGGIGQPQLIGIDIDSTGITFRYNVPLRNHSGKFSIRYDRPKKQLSMESLFLGQARGRWDEGSERVTLLEAAGALSLLSKPKVTLHDLMYSCAITDERDLDASLQEYRDIAVLSLAGVTGDVESRFIEKLSNSGGLEKAARLVISEHMTSEIAVSVLRKYVDTRRDNHNFAEVLGYASELSKNGDLDMRESALALFGKVIERGQGISEAIVAVLELIKDADWHVRNSAFELFKKIIERGEGISEAIAAASELSKDADGNVRRTGLELFEVIVKRGEGISEAIAVASELSKDADGDVRRYALGLFEKIVERGQGIDEAFAEVLALSKDANWRVQNSALLLFRKVKPSLSISDAIAAVSEFSKNTNRNVRSEAIRLFREFVDRGQGIREAIAAGSVMSKDDDGKIRRDVLLLFIKIVNLGQGISEAIAISSELSKDADLDVRESALALFGKVIERGEGISEAIAAASELNKNADFYVRKSGLALFGKIIERGEGISEAIAAASELSKDAYLDVRKSTLALFGKIIERGEGISEAIAAASELSNDADLDVRESALALFGKVIERGEGISEAIAAASELSKHVNDDVRESAVALFGKIIERGEGISEAIAAASELSKDANGSVRRIGLELFEVIVKGGEGISESIAVASELSKHVNDDVRESAVALFGKIIDRGEGISEAIAAASELSKHPHYDSRESAVALFGKIIERGQGINEVIVAATQMSKDADWFIRRNSPRLFEKIVERGQGIREAIAAASEVSVDDNVLALFQKTLESVTQGHGVPEAIEAARALSHQLPSELNDLYFKLWEVLIATPAGSLSAKQLVEEEWHYWQYFNSDYKGYLSVLTHLQKMLKEKGL